MSDTPTDGWGQLREIVAFAIQREQEAVQFYTQLAGRVNSNTLALELRSIAAMEIQHRQRLEQLDLAAAAATINPRPRTLDLGDYLVAKQPAPDMTWQEILTIAMQRELAATRLYTDLARAMANPLARQLFENLAAEETKHKLFFEQVYENEVLLEN